MSSDLLFNEQKYDVALEDIDQKDGDEPLYASFTVLIGKILIVRSKPNSQI